MSHTLFSLIAYITWMICLLVSLGMFRSFLTFTGQKAANSYKPDGSDVSEFSVRLCRAHANCYEFFPIVGGLLLAALATNNSVITESLALYLIGARILQSITHVSSTSVIAVYIRFVFFIIQTAICIYWITLFLSL